MQESWKQLRHHKSCLLTPLTWAPDPRHISAQLFWICSGFQKYQACAEHTHISTASAVRTWYKLICSALGALCLPASLPPCHCMTIWWYLQVAEIGQIITGVWIYDSLLKVIFFPLGSVQLQPSLLHFCSFSCWPGGRFQGAQRSSPPFGASVAFLTIWLLQYFIVNYSGQHNWASSLGHPQIADALCVQWLVFHCHTVIPATIICFVSVLKQFYPKERTDTVLTWSLLLGFQLAHLKVINSRTGTILYFSASDSGAVEVMYFCLPSF